MFRIQTHCIRIWIQASAKNPDPTRIQFQIMILCDKNLKEFRLKKVLTTNAIHFFLNPWKGFLKTLGNVFGPLQSWNYHLFVSFGDQFSLSWSGSTKLQWVRIRSGFETLKSSVADPGCLSRIRLFSIPDPIFFHPGSRIRIFSIPGSGYASNNLSILTQKNVSRH